MSPPLGAVAEDELVEDDRVAKGLFRIVVGRRHAVDGQKSKEPVVIAFGVNEPLAQVFGLRMATRRFADAFEPGIKSRDFVLGVSEGNLARVAQAADLAGVCEEGARLLAKAEILWTLSGREKPGSRNRGQATILDRLDLDGRVTPWLAASESR